MCASRRLAEGIKEGSRDDGVVWEKSVRSLVVVQKW